MGTAILIGVSGLGPALFDRVPMLIGAGAITAGVSAAMCCGAGIAIATTESTTGSGSSTSDSSGPGDGRTQPAKPDADSRGGTLAVDAAEPSRITEFAAADANSDANSDFANTNDAAVNDAEFDAADVDAADVDAADVAAADVAAAEDHAEFAEADISLNADAETGSQDVGKQDAGKQDAGSQDVGKQDAGKQDPDTYRAAIQPSALAVPVSESLDTTALDTTALDTTALDKTAPLTVGGPTDAEPGAGVRGAAGRLAAPLGVTSATEPEVVSKPTPVIEPLTVLSSSDPPSADASAPRQTLLSVVGAIIFNLYSFAIRVVGGPPLLPWGSAVTVHSSKLEIDCGDGYEVPADWYVPEGPNPTQLIYLQHGFLAAGPFYSYTASRLAETTQSIVVTTSLTSNFLACDGCWVGGSPMHRAVADLFVDENTALNASAAAAGFGPSLLGGVEKVVLTGHSAGGGLATGAAGYMAQNGAIDRLAGVVMLDGVGFGPVVPEALAKLPDELPVYNLAGKAYFWNLNGSAGAALEKERPGKFNGVRLIGGLHSDTMLGGNPLIQAGLNLVTGWSKVENVKAAEILSAAWINDMFAGSPTSRFYGAPGTMLEIKTPRGSAEAYVTPGPPERLTVIDVAFEFFVDIVFGLDFATCAVPSDGPFALPPGQPTGIVMELAKPNTALPLDGHAKPGHSIGQHVYEGFSETEDASQRPARLERAERC